MTKVLYLRVPDEIHETVRRLAADAGLPINRVAEILLGRQLGIPTAGDRIMEILRRINEE